ncbi:MAG: nitroreductase family protein [Deltaproteobacteria bacterium]|nr:nitroreductase family protein [Deltaproteobacteria bacterium]
MTPERMAEAISTRQSVRRYDGRPVDEALVLSLLEATLLAPSPHNTQPWRFVVIREAATKERLACRMGEKLRHDLKKDKLTDDEIEGIITRSYQRITAAPVVIVICLVREGMRQYPDRRRNQAELLMFTHSVGAAVQNLLLAAEARGLCACWMAAPVYCSPVVARALKLPPGVIPHAIVTLGYGVKDVAARRPRRLLSDLTLHR